MENSTPSHGTKWADPLFKVSKGYSTFVSSAAKRKKNVLLSFTQLIFDVFIKDIAKGGFKNRFPFSSLLNNSDTIAYTSDIPLDSVSKSKLLISLGHNYPMDPGAVTTYNGQVLTEVEMELHTFDSLARVLQQCKNSISFDVLPFSGLNVLIEMINKISKARIAKKAAAITCISIHSDSARPDIDVRPLTLGLYYGSSRGKLLCEAIASGYMKRMETRYPNDRASFWIRHHSESPRGSLGIIKLTDPVSIIAEIDFINRPFDQHQKAQEAFAFSVLHSNSLADV